VLPLPSLVRAVLGLGEPSPATDLLGDALVGEKGLLPNRDSSTVLPLATVRYLQQVVAQAVIEMTGFEPATPTSLWLLCTVRGDLEFLKFCFVEYQCL
jgi:hypothetical protein